ncbi:twin-arginine translocase TatA/TatE family subunit [Paenibacillus albiflavus]|nr:twin-arginine translocase TatA/TatE family subunit [Paenibacillus albiflavus]
MGIGLSEYLIIALVMLILFGPNKLPELGRAFGKMLHEFKKGTRGIMDDDTSTGVKEQPVSEPATQSTVVTPQEKKPVDSRRLPD